MADKSQTINIVYKFNTSEIDKAQAALNRANAASNKLQQSASQGGSAIQREFNKSSKTINDIRTAMTRLKSVIEVTSDPKKLAQLSGEYRTMKKSLDEAIKSTLGLGKANSEASKGVQSLVLGFRELSRFAGAAIIATLVKETVDLTLSMATLKGQVEGVERGFERAFTNPQQTLKEVREATHGTLTDFELMKRTLQATNLGVSVEHLGTLFEFAAARAQQTGESVDYLVDSIVRGIGRKSPLVLDNLGISVTALKEKFDGASIASKSVAEATEGVAEIAREQLTKMGGYVDTAETKVRQFNVALENVRITLAKKIESSAFVEFLTQQLKNIDDTIKGQKQLTEEFIKTEAATRAAGITESNAMKALKEDKLEQIKLIVEEIGKLNVLRQNRLKLIEEEKKAIAQRLSTVPGGASLVEGAIERSQLIKDLQRSIEIYDEEGKILAKVILEKERERLLDKDKIRNLEAMREELKELERQFSEDFADKDLLVPTPEVKAKVKEINNLRHEIERIEALLKDPKKLKVKVEVFEDEFLKEIMSFFAAGGSLSGSLSKAGDLAKKEFNPATGEFFDREAAEASEVIDVEAMEEGAKEAADVVGNAFGTRLRLALKRQSVSDKDIDLQDALIDLELGGIDILADQLSSIADIEAEAFQKRLRDTKAFYDTQQILAGNNEKAKDILRLREDRKIAELRKKQFVAEQKASKQQALIHGAAAVVKVFASISPPASFVVAALVAAQTLSQIAIIDRQQPRFAKGVIDLKGPGTQTSDSIPAWLSRGESVMTAWETKNAGGILKDIRAKKLDDKVLKSLKDRNTIQPVFNDEKIIKAIEKNRPPDVIEQSGVVYKATKINEEYRNKIRAKSVRI